MIASEGALGVIVGATLRLLPRPKGRQLSLSAWFADVEAAASAAVAATAAGLTPSILELLDEPAVALLRAHLAADADAFPFAPGGGILIGQCDGPRAEDDLDSIVAELRRVGGEVDVAANAAEGSGFSRSVAPSIRRWSLQARC